ncbi:MAG: addiction module toxin RelE [Bacteroidetes bacterium GWD2_45_23]|jgi:mRNA interferase YafQ|nr:type II toxin-antitoxin system YafQ family toxin [Proteiniphilum sp.]OFX56372.1 MAG: addiction module toxin RelE [Bacteroidetes bacterium GWC2_46_850]OFX82202.1 MAG: addiction module toxin RelE [Bacteroidetes bacterium GWC1_47_7]OFX85012.1 MAG: addiction module toxin RelE [Bacteroidetes bacterium GWD2_45_23]HAR37300.1 type II toxin-antitoxin system YafQ family toxin [Porphyromonadaceae bacterium]
MFELQFTRQFKKDFKRYKSDPVKVREVFSLLKLLERGDSIPKEFKPHRLKGNYKDYLECHIESDLLLIWLSDEKEKIIKLIRLGSHSELFE